MLLFVCYEIDNREGKMWYKHWWNTRLPLHLWSLNRRTATWNLWFVSLYSRHQRYFNINVYCTICLWFFSFKLIQPQSDRKKSQTRQQIQRYVMAHKKAKLNCIFITTKTWFLVMPAGFGKRELFYPTFCFFVDRHVNLKGLHGDWYDSVHLIQSRFNRPFA